MKNKTKNVEELITIASKNGDLELIKTIISKTKYVDFFLKDLYLLMKEKSTDEKIVNYANKELCRLLNSNRKQLIVTYDVKGHDHDGYCSGVDGGPSGSDNEDEWERREIQVSNAYEKYQFTYDRFLKSEFLKDFDYTNGECTSGGSGYCRNMYQTYKCKSVEWIRE